MRADDLFQQHAPEIAGYFHRRVGSPELAADLCQEVYLRLRRLERADGGAPLQNPRAFLFRIARNLLIDHLRQQHARPATVALHDPALRLESEAPTPEAAASSAQTSEALSGQEAQRGRCSAARAWKRARRPASHLRGPASWGSA